jgi:hypothetical protein
MPGTNQGAPSVMQREVVSGAPLFKLAPLYRPYPVVSVAIPTPSFRPDVAYSTTLLTDSPNALDIPFPFFLLHTFPH